AGVGAGGGAGVGMGGGAARRSPPPNASRPRAAAVTSGQPNERATPVSICAERCSSRVSRSTTSTMKSSNGRTASWIRCTLWLWRSDAERESVSRTSLAFAWHSTSGRNTGSSWWVMLSTRFSTSIACCIAAAISPSSAPVGAFLDRLTGVDADADGDPGSRLVPIRLGQGPLDRDRTQDRAAGGRESDHEAVALGLDDLAAEGLELPADDGVVLLEDLIRGL